MKVKKLLALVLSAIMAVSMLTACGGGGGGTGGSKSLDYTTINRYVHYMNSGVSVKSSTETKAAAKEAASEIAAIPEASAMYAFLNYNAHSKIGKQFVSDETVSESDINMLLATMGIGAAKQWGVSVFYVSAERATTSDGVTGWALGYEQGWY